MTALRYLVVDDSPTIRLTIRKALVQESVAEDLISEAGNAREAIAAYDRDHPDVVFMDVSLTSGNPPAPTQAGSVTNLLAPPRSLVQNGNDVVRYMTARNPKLTVVVCTGNSPDDPRVRELIQGGAFQLLQKPVRLAQIRDVVQQLTAERAAADSGA
jgi:CheY-like chemotaxis protein